MLLVSGSLVPNCFRVFFLVTEYNTVFYLQNYKMNKQNKYQTVNNLQKISEEMKDKGYQLEGVFPKFASRVPTEHAAFFRKTLDEIQAMGRRLSIEVVNLESAFTKIKTEEKDNRKAISELKSVNFRLKRKLDEYETDEFDDSLLSSQEGNASNLPAAMSAASTAPPAASTTPCTASTAPPAASNAPEQREQEPSRSESD